MTDNFPENNPKDNPAPKVVIIGVGNLLMKDEGIGIHTVQHLQEMELPGDIDIIDGGTSPDIVACTRAGNKLIIIDAAKAGGEPGTIYRFKPEGLVEDAGAVLSVHEMGVPQNLKLMALSGNEPSEVVFIGIEPKEIDWGTELSAELEMKIPDIIRVVLKELDAD